MECCGGPPTITDVSLFLLRALIFAGHVAVLAMSSWAALYHDLLRLVFGQLSFRDLLNCAQVCRSWSRFAARDEFWIARLCERYPSIEAELRRHCRAPGFGELSIKDLFLFPRLKDVRGTALRHFHRCPFHPIRHGKPTFGNLWRLARFYFLHGNAFWFMSGARPPLTSELKNITIAQRHYRVMRYGDNFDRLVVLGIKTVCAFHFVATLCALIFYRYATPTLPRDSHWHWLQPLLLGLLLVPFAAFLGAASPLVFTSDRYAELPTARGISLSWWKMAPIPILVGVWDAWPLEFSHWQYSLLVGFTVVGWCVPFRRRDPPRVRSWPNASYVIPGIMAGILLAFARLMIPALCWQYVYIRVRDAVETVLVRAEFEH